MRLIIQIMCLLNIFQNCQAQHSNPRKIEKNGMSVQWEIQGEWLYMEMIAPTTGWVAVGLNPDEGLEGTHLIMAAVEAGTVNLSDRHIVAPGDHRSIVELGGRPALILVEGSETTRLTSVSFKMPLRASDRFHHNLEPGKKFYLLMAFSLEDDFMHHSVMRTSVEISI